MPSTPTTHPALIIADLDPDRRLIDLAIRTGWPLVETTRPREAMQAVMRYRPGVAVVEVSGELARACRLVECLRLCATRPHIVAWNLHHTLTAEQHLRAAGVSCYQCDTGLEETRELVMSAIASARTMQSTKSPGLAISPLARSSSPRAGPNRQAG